MALPLSEAITGVIDFHHEQHLEALNTARKSRVKAKKQDYISCYNLRVPYLPLARVDK